MKRSYLKAIVLAIVTFAANINGSAQTGIGLKQYTSAHDLTTIKAEACPEFTCLAVSKPRYSHPLECAPAHSIVYPDEYPVTFSSMSRHGPNKHRMGIGLLISGSVCLLGAGAAYIQANSNIGTDSWAVLGYDLLAGALAGCGLGLSIPGLVLTIKYSGNTWYYNQ